MTAGIINTPRDVAVLNALSAVTRMAGLGGPEGYATVSWRDSESGLLLSIGASAPNHEDDQEGPADVGEPLF